MKVLATRPYAMVGLVALLLFALAFPVLFANPTVTTMAVFTLMFAGMATAWNILAGYSGYISLGHAAFFGVGAYALALMCQNWNVPGGYVPFVLLPLVGLVAAALAVPLGWIALRTRRHTFVVITIAIFFIMQLLAYNLRGLTRLSTHGVVMENGRVRLEGTHMEILENPHIGELYLGGIMPTGSGSIPRRSS